jgi:CBS-domain-containing membrane protein
MDKRLDRSYSRLGGAATMFNSGFALLSIVLKQYAEKISAPRPKPVKIAKRKLVVPSAASLAGAALGIASIGFISSYFSIPLLVAPFGASAVLLFSIYDSPLAQPRNTVFGHILSVLIGGLVALAFMAYPGSDFIDANAFLPVAVAVPLSIFSMQILRISHPPAGATAFIASTALTSVGFFLSLVIAVAAGSLILVAIALIFNNAVPGRRYPFYW